jgi:hypothetical protein
MSSLEERMASNASPWESGREKSVPTHLDNKSSGSRRFARINPKMRTKRFLFVCRDIRSMTSGSVEQNVGPTGETAQVSGHGYAGREPRGEFHRSLGISEKTNIHIGAMLAVGPRVAAPEARIVSVRLAERVIAEYLTAQLEKRIEAEEQGAILGTSGHEGREPLDVRLGMLGREKRICRMGARSERILVAQDTMGRTECLLGIPQRFDDRRIRGIREDAEAAASIVEQAAVEPARARLVGTSSKPLFPGEGEDRRIGMPKDIGATISTGTRGQFGQRREATRWRMRRRVLSGSIHKNGGKWKETASLYAFIILLSIFYPTLPSISMPINIFISAAYSSGNSRMTGARNHDTIMVRASASENPRDRR